MSYKCNRFFKILLKKNFKFILYTKDNIIAFNLSFMLLLAKVDFILKKQSYKKDVLMVYGIGCIKIVLILLTKIIVLYA